MAIRTPSNARPSRSPVGARVGSSARPFLKTRRGFSLVELLVVILIIGIIVAIVLPSLAGVRDKAKEAASRQLTNEIASAASTFYNDKRRSPGYFTPQEMGDASNQARGFTAMQNAMLDLAGGIVRDGTAGAVNIGPSTVVGRQVAFLPEAVGATGNGNYFTPNAKNFQLQNGSEGGLREGDAVHQQVPELVDAWNQPILAWVEDPTAKQAVQAVADFATVASPGNNPNLQSARFYLNSNFALLNTPAFGKQRKNQVDLSLLSRNQNNAATSLAGAMGNPGAPDDPSRNLTAILPTRSRGSFVVHSAGRDGVILSRADRRAIPIVDNADNTATATLYYGANFKSLPGPAGTVIRDNTGKAVSEDVMSVFDDIIASAN